MGLAGNLRHSVEPIIRHHVSFAKERGSRSARSGWYRGDEMNEPGMRQARFNHESRDQWDGFAAHRAKVSALLGAGEPRGATRLCVLGAGNCNDLDLVALREAHREVHLVDLDARAIEGGVARRGLADCEGLHRHGGLDVTGMLDAIAGWSPVGPIPGEDLAALVEWPSRRVGLALPGPFDLVASTCLLSQIVGNAARALGEAHPRFADAVRALRLGHLRLLAQLASPGGRVVLITDVVSSDHEPALITIPEVSLAALLPRLARRGALIHGVNPAQLLSVFRTDPVLASRVVGLETTPPWLWKLHERAYLVRAIRCRIGSR
jgi:hypothetical protein